MKKKRFTIHFIALFIIASYMFTISFDHNNHATSAFRTEQMALVTTGLASETEDNYKKPTGNHLESLSNAIMKVLDVMVKVKSVL